jgi:hypothetical protein
MENAAGRIAIVDISNPASMTSIGTVTMNGGGNTPRTLAVQGRYLFYVSPSNTTLQCYDIHGAHVQHLESGTIESSYLLVKRDASFIGDIDTRGNLAVGENLFVHGRASAFQYRSASSGTSYTDPETNLLPMFYARNHSNSSTSAHAIMGLRVGGASGGDPFISLDIAGVTGWSLGVDNSDSDKFKIANNWSDVGTTTRLTIDTSGNVGIGTTSPAALLDVNGPMTTLLTTTVDPDNFVNRLVAGTIADGSGWSANGIAVSSGTGQAAAFAVAGGSLWIGVQNGSAANTLSTILQHVGSNRYTLFPAGNVGIGANNSPNSTLHVDGSIAFKISSISANTTLDGTYTHVFASGTITITLPTAVGISGRTYWIKRTGTGTITINTTSSQTIDGAASLSITAQYDSYTLVSDGSNWFIV